MFLALESRRNMVNELAIRTGTGTVPHPLERRLGMRGRRTLIAEWAALYECCRVERTMMTMMMMMMIKLPISPCVEN